MRILSTALAIMTVAGGLALGFAPVSAAPLPGPSAMTSTAADATSAIVEQARHYRNHGWRNNRGWHGNRGWHRGQNWRGNRGWNRRWNRY